MALSRYFAVILISSVFSSPAPEVRSSVHETPETIISNGYRAERHHVTTEDGYILEMHRIPFKRHATSGDADRPVVFVMHGLMAASNTFVMLEPEYAIAYNLADAGFDVWMGNHRGTKNSRYHVTLNPDYSGHRIDFFDFTWEDIGMIDIPAMIDYILEKTGNEKLHYIGHSQGGTVFLVMGSMRPEYNEKLATVDLLAGVGYMEYFPNSFLVSLAQHTETIWALALRLGIVEIFPPIASIIGNNRTTVAIDTQNRLSDYCTGDPEMKSFCDLIGISEIIEPNSIIVDIIQSIEPGGAAMKQIAHYGQNVKSKKFQRWDFGTELNLENYGTPNPPTFNLSLITADVVMHYTVSDILLDERDVIAMAEDMPNMVARKIARESFLHADFVFARDVRELVTEYIIERINPSNGTETDNEPGSAVSVFLSLNLQIYLVIYCLINLY